MAHAGLLRQSKSLTLAWAALLAAPAWAAPAQEELLRMLEQLSRRLEPLEKRNGELEEQIQGRPAGTTLDTRVQSLEEAQARISKGLESENISD